MILHSRHDQIFRPDQPDPTLVDVIPGMRERNCLPHPFVEPQDVTSAVLFLASDESRFITGTELKVDLGIKVR